MKEEHTHYVYVLVSTQKAYIYVGMTQNVEKRVYRHQSGHEKTTRPFKPYNLVHVETYATRIEARKREKYLKSGCGKEWIKKQLCSGGGIGRRASLRG